ncbi:MAG: LacI family DNA-binding transcriptional regulator [Promicromonosporaceae bacterium]|nr:LacI family DNA-binding transcriptional regulator [Promicromonosporaceae bacterium]
MPRSASDRPTLALVAQRAGVSVSTASLAFSGAGPITSETRDRVLAAATELGYHGPNPLGRQLRSGRCGIVGVVLGDNPGRAFRDPVSIRVLDGLMEVLGEHRLGVLLIPGNQPQSIAPLDPLVASAAMDVAVLIWGALPDDPNLAALGRRGVPVVLCGEQTLPGVPVVRIDDRAGAAEAVRHLTELGHTRIAEITLPLDVWGAHSGVVTAARIAEATVMVTVARLAGFRDVIEPVITWEASASFVEHGREAALSILGEWVPASQRPTAIFAQTDQLAAGAVIAARELGLRVPEDVSIVGFDGLDLPWLSPDVLTSVHQPLRAKGVAMGQAVVGLLAGEEPQVVTLPTQLIEGTTTTKAEG